MPIPRHEERDGGELACAFHPGGTMLLRSRGLLRTCRVWERLEARPQDCPEKCYCQTLSGCFPADDFGEAFYLAFQIAVGQEDEDGQEKLTSEQPALTAVLKILADCQPDGMTLPRIQLLTRTRARGQSAWLQVVQTECLPARTRNTTLRVHVAQPVSLISFRLNIQSLAPLCTVCISAVSLPIAIPPPERIRPVNRLALNFQPWLAIIQSVNLESLIKLSATCTQMRGIVNATFVGDGGLVNCFVRRHLLDERRAVEEFGRPADDCSIFALEDQPLFHSEWPMFANLLLNRFTFVCDIATEPCFPMQLFYGAQLEKISSGPSLTFESWIDQDAKHTIQLIVIMPPPPLAGPDATPLFNEDALHDVQDKEACNISLQIRLLPSSV